VQADGRRVDAEEDQPEGDGSSHRSGRATTPGG
jgi:hypothetical protein